MFILIIYNVGVSAFFALSNAATCKRSIPCWSADLLCSSLATQLPFGNAMDVCSSVSSHGFWLLMSAPLRFGCCSDLESETLDRYLDLTFSVILLCTLISLNAVKCYLTQLEAMSYTIKCFCVSLKYVVQILSAYQRS